MKTILLILILTTSAQGFAAVNKDALKEAKVLELMSVIQLDRALTSENVIAITETNIRSSAEFAKLSVEKQKEQLAGVRKSIGRIDLTKMKSDMAQVYADTYSIDEIEGMTEFYRSPLGQKVLSHQQQIAMGMQRVMMNTVSDTMASLKAESRIK